MSAAPDLPGDLLSLAREDLAAAEALDRAERVSDAPVGFHAQQAVEKALKAAIASHGQDLPFAHDIGLLMQLCQDNGSSCLPISPRRIVSPLRGGNPLWPWRSERSADPRGLAVGGASHRVGRCPARPRFLVTSRSHRGGYPAGHASDPPPFKRKDPQQVQQARQPARAGLRRRSPALARRASVRRLGRGEGPALLAPRLRAALRASRPSGTSGTRKTR